MFFKFEQKENSSKNLTKLQPRYYRSLKEVKFFTDQVRPAQSVVQSVVPITHIQAYMPNDESENPSNQPYGPRRSPRHTCYPPGPPECPPQPPLTPKHAP